MKPTQPGYYWTRTNGRIRAAAIVRVFIGTDGNLCIRFPGSLQEHSVEILDGEWVGPLVSPWEDEDGPAT